MGQLAGTALLVGMVVTLGAAPAAGAAGAAARGAGAAPTAPAARAACPARIAPSTLAGPAALRALNAAEWSYGPRPTGSPAHRRMVAWLARELHRVPGLHVTARRYRIDAWAPRSAALRVQAGGRTLTVPVAAPVPYSAPTAAAGRSASLAAVPDGVPITAANAAGRIVVRNAPPGRVPLAVFAPGALGFAVYDPHHTIDPTAPFEGDFLNYDARVHDLRDAAQAGAAGVVFLKDLPRAQLRGHFEPYEGRAWKVPGVFLGADEAQALTDALQADPGARGTLTLRARRPRVTTRTLLATLPGRSSQRLVIESHTDGTNAVEDNGPVAILALARGARPAAAGVPAADDRVRLPDRALLPARHVPGPPPRRRRRARAGARPRVRPGRGGGGDRARAPRRPRVPRGPAARPSGPRAAAVRPPGADAGLRHAERAAARRDANPGRAPPPRPHGAARRRRRRRPGARGRALQLRRRGDALRRARCCPPWR